MLGLHQNSDTVVGFSYEELVGMEPRREWITDWFYSVHRLVQKSVTNG